MKPRSFRPGLVLALAAGVGACGGGGGGGGSAPPPTGLSYANPNVVLSECAAASANLPTVLGGTPSSFSVFPSLPAGLTLNPSTGAIAGTPTVAAAQASYTITASNSGGSAQASVTLEVLDTTPSGLTYPASALDFAVAVETSYSPTLGAGTPTSYVLQAGSLPGGLALDATTGVIDGAPTEAALGASAALTVRALHCSGAFLDVPLTVNVRLPQAALALVLQEGEPVLSTYLPDAFGGFAPTEHALSLDTAASAACATPDGRWLIVAEGDRTALSTYRCRSDGRVESTGLLAGCGPGVSLALAVSPNSRFVYGVTSEPLLRTWSLDPQTGALSEVGIGIAAPSEPTALALAPSGRFAYVAGAFDGEIASYTLDSITGAPTHGLDLATGGAPNALVVSANSDYLVCADALRGLVSYSIHPSSGVLAPVAGVPVVLPGGRYPSALCRPPRSPFVHAAREFAEGIDSFELTPAGALLPVGTGTVATLRPVTGFVATPDGERVHALVEGFGWLAFDSQPDGSLAPADVPRTTGRTLSRVLALAPGVTAPRPQPAQLYLATTGAPRALAIAPNGSLSPLASTTGAPGSTATTSIAVHPWLDVAWYASPDRAIGVANVLADGSLSVAIEGAAGAGSDTLALDPSGRMVLELVDTVPAVLRAWTIDLSNGELTLQSSQVVGDGPSAFAFHPAGSLCFVACGNADEIPIFAIDPATGEPVPWSTVLTGASPRSVVIDGSGTLIAWIEQAATVVVQDLDPIAGVPNVLAASFNSLVGATALAFDATGEHLIVGGAGGTLRAFAVDRTTGALTNTGLALAGAAPTRLERAPGTNRFHLTLSGGSARAVDFTAGVGFTQVGSGTVAGEIAGFAVRAPVR
ncbi:MAG: beta-propeller fold lactonase family protein [Planctomycetota bacterium]|nr:beta-propeller fold lactonase family protein [Planctomycetota bacterium]